MADDSQAATTLLTEHLQYTPLSLLDDIVNSVNTFIYQGIESLEKGLHSTPPERLGYRVSKPADSTDVPEIEYSEAKQDIDEGLHKLETLLNSTFDKNFDKLEIYVLRNILSAPADLVNWMHLSHYEGIAYPPPVNAPTVETIQLLRRKLAASRNVSRALASEYNRNEVMLAQMRSLLSVKVEDDTQPNLSFLSSTVSQQPFSGQQPLTTNTQFTLSQLPALKSIVLDLKARLPTLESDRANADSARDELREDRRQYIEQRTKSHLERNGNSATNASGPISGKQTDTAEVEALEKAANMFNPP